MPANARKDIVDPTEVGIYHCYSRCVRRAYLCGEDKVTGKCYDYRRDWIEIRLQQLLAVFMIDLLAYGLLDNHLHLLLRIRPDLVRKLTDREVARLSLMLSAGSMPETVELDEPSDAAIDKVLQDPEQIQEWRERLSSLSWFMRYLKEPISRRANKEDGVTGAFWEKRFDSPRMLDTFGVLLCCVYVDLNEVRAKKAETPEASQRSSIGKRIAAWKSSLQQLTDDSRDSGGEEVREPAPPWMSPINEASDNGTPSRTMTEERPNLHGPRPSDSGFLPMTLEQYMMLVDWTGRSLRPGKRGAIPSSLEPIMSRLVSNLDAFLKVTQNFQRLFRRACGSPDSLIAYAEKARLKRIQGLRLAQRLCPTQ